MKKIAKMLSILLVLVLTVAMATACEKEEETHRKSRSKGSTKSSRSRTVSETEKESKDFSETEETPIIVFGTNAEFPPFEFNTSSGVIGTFDGIDMAIAKQIAEDHGKTAEIEDMEFDSLLVALQNDQVDAVIAGMTVTEDRKKSVDFSIPYYNATQVMLVKEDSAITNATDMEDKRIGVIQGFIGHTYVNEMGYDYEVFQKGSDALFALQSGDCDVVVIDYETAKNYVDTRASLKIVEDPNVFESEEYAIAVKKGNKELLDQINASLEAMIADGTIGVFGAVYADK